MISLQNQQIEYSKKNKWNNIKQYLSMKSTYLINIKVYKNVFYFNRALNLNYWSAAHASSFVTVAEVLR